MRSQWDRQATQCVSQNLDSLTQPLFFCFQKFESLEFLKPLIWRNTKTQIYPKLYKCGSPHLLLTKDLCNNSFPIVFTNLGIRLHPVIKSPQGPHGTFVAGKNHRLEGMWHWSQCCHHLQQQLRLPGISGTKWHNALPKTAEILTFSMPRYATLCHAMPS